MNARITGLATSIACFFLVSAGFGGEPADKPVKKTIKADTKMPAYKFTDDEVAAVIAYIKSLKPADKPKP